MDKIDLTPFMESYRLAMVDLSRRFVNCRGGRLRNWDESDEFEDISCSVFHLLVALPAGLMNLRKSPGYIFPQKIVDGLQITIANETEMLCHSEDSCEPYDVFSGKLDQAEGTRIFFSNFFDFDMMAPRPYEYVLAYSERPLKPGFGQWLRIPVGQVLKYESSGTDPD